MTRLLSIAAAAVILIAGGWYFSTTPSGEPGVTSMRVEAQDAADVDTSGIEEMTLGNPDADVTVIEYASFTCPHCKRFHLGPFQKLKADYIDPGKIEFVYREVYFDRYGLWASMIARCGGAERFFGIADMLYKKQSEWTQGQPGEIAANLRTIGKTAGLSQTQVDECLSNGDKAEALVALYQQNAEADEVNATPTFIINGEKYQNMSYEDFSDILDEKLGA